MNILDFKDEVYSHYFDADNQVTVIRNPGHWTTGNGLLHTGTFFTLLGINNAITDSDKSKFVKAIEMCWVRDSQGHTIYGLLNRNLNRPDKEAQDDYIGVCSGSFFAYNVYCYFIYKYGQDNWYCFDNTNPDHSSLSTYHGRFPGLIGFYRVCVNQPMGWLQRFGMRYKLDGGVTDNASENILTWLQVQVLKRKDPSLDKNIKLWERSFSEKYSSLGSLFSEYYGKDHPFSKIESLSGVMP